MIGDYLQLFSDYLGVSVVGVLLVVIIVILIIGIFKR